MEKETAQELGGAKGHCAGLATVGVILPAESDVFLFEGQQAMIGNGYAMGVAPQIAQHLHGTAESRLGINHPVVPMQSAEQFCELLSIGESSRRACTLELLVAVEALQAGEELPAKDATQDFYG